MGKSRKNMHPYGYWSVVNVNKVQRQKDICMGKNQMDMCPFSYWRASVVLAIGEQISSKSRDKKK